MQGEDSNAGTPRAGRRYFPPVEDDAINHSLAIPSLTVRGLVVGYPPDRPRVLAGVDVDFPARAITAIIGPNGSGKTTLLRAALGLLTPAAGEGRLPGAPLPMHQLRPADRARHVAYVAQRPALAFAYRVRDVVAMGGLMLGVGSAARAQAAMLALQDVDLVDRADDPFDELSVGQPQGVAIARALVQLRVGVWVGGGGSSHRKLAERTQSGSTPFQALLADEPISAMDPARALATMALLRRCAGEGAAVVCVLHDVAMALRAADRVVLLSRVGTVVSAGRADEVCTPEVLGPVYGVEFAAGFVRSSSGDVRTLVPVGPSPAG
jgi:iron complex transport system ATP-binding protein